VGIDFTGRVAVITGAGNGLGAEYARTLARLGAAVVVNDIGSSLDGTPDGTSPAEQVVAETFRGLARGRTVVVPGWHNQLAVAMLKLVPESISIPLIRRGSAKYHLAD